MGFSKLFISTDIWVPIETQPYNFDVVDFIQDSQQML